MKISNLINNNGNPAPNQFVIKNNGGNLIYFQSYDSMIARYDRDTRKLYVSPYWDYSNTTRKHFYIFLRRYTPYCATRKEVVRLINNGTIVVVEESEIAI